MKYRMALALLFVLWAIGAGARAAHLYGHQEWARGIAQAATGFVFVVFAYIVWASQPVSNVNPSRSTLLYLMRFAVIAMLLLIAIFFWWLGVLAYI